MKYGDGTTVALGDIVRMSVPGGIARARVVMLGDTHEHLEIEPSYLEWITAEKKLTSTDVIVEWVDANPFAHSDLRYAPVSQYLLTSLCACDGRDA